MIIIKLFSYFFYQLIYLFLNTLFTKYYSILSVFLNTLLQILFYIKCFLKLNAGDGLIWKLLMKSKPQKEALGEV